MNRTNIKIFCVILAICLIFTAAAFGVLRSSIQSSLNQHRSIARTAHPNTEDDLVALIEYMNSDQHTLRQRNLAVWALGQMRDKRALPHLTSALIGEKCDHEKNLCHKELKKAIKLCSH